MPRYTTEQIEELRHVIREPASGCVLASASSQVKALIVADALNKVSRYEKALNQIAQTMSSEDTERHRLLVNIARKALQDE